MSGILWPFLLAFVVWAGVRAFTWPLPEWVRRGFWAVVVVLAAAPMFFGASFSSGSLGVIAMCGGAAAAEVIVTGLWQRWTRYQARQEEARQAAKVREREERHERRRQRRRERQDGDT